MWGSERAVLWKFNILRNKLKKTEINGKVVHIHELEELLFFIYHYYEKPSVDSMQSQSRSQWHYFTGVGKNAPPNDLE